MSELRIRSELPPSERPMENWRPRSAQAPPDDGDDTPFEALMLALEDELTVIFGVDVTVHPGRALAPGAPDISPELAALYVTIRLGGDPTRPVSGLGGVVTARHGRDLVARLLPLAHRLWPSGSRRSHLVVDVMARQSDSASAAGSLRLAAPPEPRPAAAPQPLGTAALGLPLRIAVRLASENMPLARLVPLTVGRVIPFHVEPEMPIVLGDHQIGVASLQPMPDGRQQATILAINLAPLGERT
jgi:flagellar motor switch/type III secretory pathway protein FliN